MSDPRAVPSGWVTAKLADICDVTMGQSPESKDINEKGKGFPFFQGKAEFGSQHPYNKRFCEFPLRFADKNDVFMSVRAPVGPTNLVRERSGFGRGLCAIKAVGGNNSRFILYQLRLIEHKIAALGTGSTFTAINRGDVEGLEISVAPSMEQTRIVKKLEELFSDLDAGVAELKAAQKKLAQYRQSLLKAAVEGELTAAWRAQKTVHPELVEGQVSSIHASTGSARTDRAETGAQLLGRILAERRRRWEKKTARQVQGTRQNPTQWLARQIP